MKSTYLLTFALSLILMSGCSEKSKQNSSIFISQPLPNRPTNIPHAHDNNCVGFYKNDFDVRKLKSINSGFEIAEQIKSISHLNWNQIDGLDSIIEFNKMVKPDTNSVVYVLEIIQMENPETRILSIGSDDGIMIWLNGDTLLNSHKGRRILPFDDVLTLSLKKGVNTFLYKIDQTTGGWGLYRKWISKIELQQELSHRISELYSDLPLSCILPDTATYLNLKTNSKIRSDIFHQINITWIDKNLITIGKSVLNPANDSMTILLPEKYDGFAISDFIVTDSSGNKLFEERIPIAKESFVKSMLNQTKNRSQHNYDNEARVEGKNLFFKSDSDRKKISTRMQLSLICDLMNTENLNFGTQIKGYYSAFYKNTQPFRIFEPIQIKKQKLPLVFITHGVHELSSNYFTSYEGSSHALMTARIRQANENQLVMVMRQIKGEQVRLGDSKTELPQLYKNLTEKYSIDTTKISAIVWSRDCYSFLELLEEKIIPLKNLALISSVFPNDELQMVKLLQRLKINYPDIKLFIRHGMDDIDSPIFIVRKFVKLAKNMGFEVDYKEIPYSSHWSYLVDPEEEFYKKLEKN